MGHLPEEVPKGTTTNHRHHQTWGWEKHQRKQPPRIGAYALWNPGQCPEVVIREPEVGASLRSRRLPALLVPAPYHRRQGGSRNVVIHVFPESGQTRRSRPTEKYCELGGRGERPRNRRRPFCSTHFKTEGTARFGDRHF